MPLLTPDAFVYTLVHPEFFEPMSRYEPLSDFSSVVRRRLPADWNFNRHDTWNYCWPADAAPIPETGWKIHLSATARDALSVLDTATRVLAQARASFKFALDSKIHVLTNGKRWPRGRSGKLVTVYPCTVADCQQLLDRLSEALVGYSGPYVLSDRRYRDSRVVYYRYGGIRSMERLNAQGQRVLQLHDSDGQLQDDERNAYFSLPPGIEDPFATPAPESDGDGDPTLKNGRYLIEKALRFTNGGGVYAARDRHHDRNVVIKEARPACASNALGSDAVSNLRKEYRILRALEDTGIAPQPYDFFVDWEHSYLVEEFIEAPSLRTYGVRHSATLLSHPTAENVSAWLAKYRRVGVNILSAVHALHERHVVFGDLSHYNVLVFEDGRIRIIDFEGACEVGVDMPSSLGTAGFLAPQRRFDTGATPDDDWYAVGGLLLASIMPINSIMELDPRAYERWLQSSTRDLGIPAAVGEAVRGLLEPYVEESRGPAAERALVLLQQDAESLPVAASFATEAEEEDLPRLLQGLVDYIDAQADFARTDRLYPASSMVFHTNPLSLAYGACGIAYVLDRVTGQPRPRVLDWILAHDLSADTYAPGLGVGLAGIAWTLYDLGAVDRALEIIRASNDHPLRFASPDYFHGAAGWGLTQLRFFLTTGDEAFLDRAREAGDWLDGSQSQEDDKSWWVNDGKLYCGLGYGVAGVSLFLLYLYCATRDERYLALGRRGLSFITDRAIPTIDRGISWRAEEGEMVYTPYRLWGSAGIGSVLVRYHQILHGEPYGATLDNLLLDTERKYCIFPGRELGMCGIGDFYLDFAKFGHDPDQALRGVRKALAGLLLFKLERPNGVAFPGDGLNRISCDLATGSAGVALFLHRLLHRADPILMLDELLTAIEVA